MKKKRSKRDILRDKAWKVFSKWIRARDKNCVTCGGKPENAGHFFHAVLDFDEININAQCVRCNKWLSGNLAIYANYLISRYGVKEFEDLNIRHYRAMKGAKLNELDYERLINKYTRKLG